MPEIAVSYGMTQVKVARQVSFFTLDWSGSYWGDKLQPHRIVLVLAHSEFYSVFGFSVKMSQRIESPFGGGETWMALELWSEVLEGIQETVEISHPFNVLE